MGSRQAILLVANWDSGVGYAWWLMESYWAQLAERYCHDHRVILAFPSVSTLSKTIADAAVEPVALNMCEKGPWAVWKQCFYLKRNRVRLIYVSDWSSWRVRYLAYRASGVRIIIAHDHTPGVRSVPAGFRRWIKTALNRIPWLSVNGVLGASEFVRQRHVDVTCFPSDRCFAVPNGLPATNVISAEGKPAIKAELGIPDCRRVMVMTGRASRYKQVDFVIRCLAAMRIASRERLQFLFIGDGPDLSYFEAVAAELGVAGHCTFAGKRNDIHEILCACDMAIHPSRGEVGYSLSILEYMRAGLPVVVPDNPSVCGATVQGETGLIYREGDVSAAVECIEEILENPAAMRAMGEAARIVVRKSFRLETAHEALANAFDRLDLNSTSVRAARSLNDGS